MRDLNQEIIKFDYKKNFKDDDFYVSKSNKHIFELLNKWPKWEKNFLNINGENFSGKTHLINIFLKKFNGIKLESNSLNNNDLKDIKIHQNIVLENLNKKIDANIIVYDKNANAPNLMKKYEQLLGLGFVNVYIYPGGLFEWLLLQEVYGEDDFPTTNKLLDLLKFKGKKIFGIKMIGN